MAEFKRKTLLLSSGKQIKLFGNSIAIGRSLAIGEGYAPNIFSFLETPQEDKPAPDMTKAAQEKAIPDKTAPEKDAPEGKPTRKKTAKKPVVSIANPYHLSASDILEMADYNIRLWMDLKDNVRKHGVNDPKIFNMDRSL